MAFNHQGQRVGRPHVATWADASVVLAADLGSGRDDPRATCADLLGRALAALPAPARAGRIRLRADAGYLAGQLTRAALFADVEFAIGARRSAPLWRILVGVPADGWTDAIDMTAAQVAVADYCPNWWPAATRLLIRRVRLDLDRGLSTLRDGLQALGDGGFSGPGLARWPLADPQFVAGLVEAERPGGVVGSGVVTRAGGLGEGVGEGVEVVVGELIGGLAS